MNNNSRILVGILLIFVFKANSQINKKRKFEKVSSVIEAQQFHEMILENDSLSDSSVKCLDFKCKNLKKSYCSNKTDENYIEFHELGKIKNTTLVIINKLSYNEELFILLDKRNCKTITLTGFPLRIENSNLYLTYNNPSTDETWQIQILKIEDGNVSLKDNIIFPNEILPQRVLRIEQNHIYIVDEKNQTWKTIVNN